MAGTAAVFLATGASFGLLAHSSYGDWQDARDRGDTNRARALEDRTRSRTRIANVNFVLAGGAAITAGVLYLLGRDDQPESSGQLVVAPTGPGLDGVMVGWRAGTF